VSGILFRLVTRYFRRTGASGYGCSNQETTLISPAGVYSGCGKQSIEVKHVNGHSEEVSFIWSVADLLRDDYKASNYAKVLLPFAPGTATE
jgi:hypothetical protein